MTPETRTIDQLPAFAEIAPTDQVPVSRGGVTGRAPIGDFAARLSDATAAAEDAQMAAQRTIEAAGVTAAHVASISALADQTSIARDIALSSVSYFPTAAAGEASAIVDTGGVFAVADGSGNVEFRRKTGSGSDFIYTLLTQALLASPFGASLIGIAGGGTLQQRLDAFIVGFDQIAQRTIPAAVSNILVSDRGMALFKRVAADPGPLWPTYIKTRDASGKWFVLDIDAQELCAAHFGIVLEPWGTYSGTNEGPKLQAWLSFLANVRCPRGSDMTVEAAFDGVLDAKPATGLWKTTYLRGVMRLRGRSYVTDRYSIEIDHLPNYFVWEGGIIHSALGEATFVNRRNVGGIAIGYASRARIDILMSSYNIANGVKIVRDPKPEGGIDNANLMRFGRLGGNANGCGFEHSTFAYSNTIGGVAQYGADDSLGQRSRLSMGEAFLPSWFDAFDVYVGNLGEPAEGGAVRSDAMLIHIEGVGRRKVTHVEGNSALWVYPRVPTTAAGARWWLIAGGNAAFEGSDSNIPQIGVIEGAVSGIGAALGQSYGSCIDQLHIDGCGVAVAVGSYNGGTSIEHVVSNLYVEAAQYADVANLSTNARFHVLGGVSGGPLRVDNLCDPVSATGIPACGYSGLSGSSVRMNGVDYRDEGSVARTNHTPIFRFGGDNPKAFLAIASPVVTLASATGSLSGAVLGLGARYLEFVAYGPEGPPPDVTFAAIPGFGFNGGTPNTAMVVSGAIKPRRFSVWLDLEAHNILVTHD